MHIEVHFTPPGTDVEDSFEIEGDDIDTLQKTSDQFFLDRGLVAKECSVWSRRLK